MGATQPASSPSASEPCRPLWPHSPAAGRATDDRHPGRSHPPSGNEITKELAVWAAIIAVPTAVTGFYGQNIPYPGFGRHSGFITSCIIMIVLAGALYWLLRRNDWL